MLAKIRQRRPTPRTIELAKLPLLEFIPAITKRFAPPHHLAPFLDLFERIARGERVLAVVSAPPRHGKTESEIHAIAWLLARRPEMQLAFVGYAARFADKKSAKARDLARTAGVPISSTSSSKQDWRTGIDDGGLWASSIGGSLTGEGFSLCLVDDPTKDRATAESAAARDSIYEWFTDTAFTRLEPNGSCLVTATRWHDDDLPGRLIREGWDNICLPAIDDNGGALWPERFSAENLSAIRDQLGEYGWWSLYQGKPRPRGGALFQDAHTFDTLPDISRTVIGIDFAYTARTHADYSVAVVMSKGPPAPKAPAPPVFVREVVRQQVDATAFAAELRRLKTAYPGAKLVAYVGGTEKGVVDLLNSKSFGLGIEAKPAKADKFVRAQPVAAAWNAGRVRLRAGASWFDSFVNEVRGFTGVGDKHDDQIDAMASGFDALDAPVPVSPSSIPANIFGFAPARS